MGLNLSKSEQISNNIEIYNDFSAVWHCDLKSTPIFYDWIDYKNKLSYGLN